MYRVLLVDDHQIVRAGIRAILEDRYVSIAVAEASTGEAALAALVNPFDAVVLDLAMPGRSGIDLLVEIKHRFPKLPVLIVSMYAEDQFAVRALRAGASGYLTKAAAPNELVTAFERILRGGRYISDAVATRLAEQLESGRTAATPHDRLSDREFEVLRHLASGKTVGAIAEVMCLSIKTVSTYRTRLLEKMGMQTNAELTRYAIEHGLV